MEKVPQGARPRFKVDTPLKGKIIGVRTVQDRGRIQIPKKIRDRLNLQDGDQVYWMEYANLFYITKAVELG